MLKGILTGLLSKESRDKGYELSEDEDFIYLHNHQGAHLVCTFTVKGATLENIEQYIHDYPEGRY